MAVNKVILLGGICKDLELVSVGTGDAVKCEFTVATSERRKDKSSGEYVEETEFHNCVAWNGTAKYIAKWGKKGSQAYVEAKSTTRSWDAQDGTKKYRHEFIAFTVELVANRRTKEEVEGTQSNASNPPAQSSGEGNFGEPPAVDVSDLPF